MSVPAEQVKKLREISGAPMMECKRALEEAQGEMEKAFTVLRKRGLATAAKKAGRTTSEGVVGSYIHAGGKIGVLVEVNCESDFVARNEEFQQLAHDLAMQICATDPRFIRKEDVTPRCCNGKRKSCVRRRRPRESRRMCWIGSWKASWESSTRITACTSSISSRTAAAR